MQNANIKNQNDNVKFKNFAFWIVIFHFAFFILNFTPLNASYSYLQLDEVRMYDRVLSQSEIQKLYNLGQDKVNASPTNRLTA